MKYLYLFFLFIIIPGFCLSQAITNYHLTDDGGYVLRVSSVFDSNGPGPLTQDNSTITLFIPTGLTAPAVSDLQGGSWSVTANIPNPTLQGLCPVAVGYYMIQVSTGGQANLGAVTAGVAEDLFTAAFSGTSALPVFGFDPTGVEPISACLIALSLGADNTASIDPDGNGGPLPAVGYGGLPVTPGGVILPVELLDFVAKPINGKDGELKWRTATEGFMSHFVIERSTDSRDWNYVGQLPAAGNSAIPLRYSYTDKNVYSNSSAVTIFYYRLKMVDQDGSFEYTPVRSVKFIASTLLIKVFPNPARDHIQLSLINFDDLSSDMPFQMKMINVLGELVGSATITNELTTIQTDKLQTGIYSLMVYDNAGKLVGQERVVAAK